MLGHHQKLFTQPGIDTIASAKPVAPAMSSRPPQSWDMLGNQVCEEDKPERNGNLICMVAIRVFWDFPIVLLIVQSHHALFLSYCLMQEMKV